MYLADRCLAYGKATADLAIVIPDPSICMRLVGYSDANWGSIRDGAKSQTGYLIGFEDENDRFFPVIWKSCLQKSTAQSSMAAELYAFHSMISAMSHLIAKRPEMGLPKIPIFARSDSRDLVDACRLGNKRVYRDKRMLVTIAGCREMLQDNLIDLEHITRDKNYADDMCKPTEGSVIRRLMARIDKRSG